jgi:hypothetical protein
MARLTKSELFQRFRSGIEATGWDVEILSAEGAHPMEAVVTRGRTRLRLRTYIWNLSHGGRSRSASEFRIQVTSGVGQFEKKAGEQTVILGWGNAFGVFAAFDYDSHSAALGSSPSLQINKATLEEAASLGIAGYAKANNEIVIAVRPDFFGDYLKHQGRLHDPAASKATIQEIRTSSPEPDDAELSDYISRYQQGTKPRFGLAVERARRRAILESVSRFRVEQAAEPGRGMIGHNRPPPDAQELSPWADEVSAAVEFIRKEMEQDEPNPAAVAESALLLNRAARAWRAMASEIKKLPHTVKEKAREHVAEALLAVAAATLLKIVGGVLTWLSVIFSQ